MYIYKKIRVKLNERVVAFRNGLPFRALAPGRHVLWDPRVQRFRQGGGSAWYTGRPSRCSSIRLALVNTPPGSMTVMRSGSSDVAQRTPLPG